MNRRNLTVKHKMLRSHNSLNALIGAVFGILLSRFSTTGKQVGRKLHGKFRLRMTKAKHETRSRYISGCRCRRCRKANSEYSTKRQQQLLEEGKCRRCGKDRDGESVIYCNQCLEKVR